jgi:hypothetical protein
MPSTAPGLDPAHDLDEQRPQTERPPAGGLEGDPSTAPGRLGTTPSVPPGCAGEAPAPDAAELADWLRLLYSRCPADLWLAGSMVARTGERPGQLRARAFRPVADLDRLADELATTAERHDVYVGCCPLSHRPSKGRGRAGDVAALPALWADLDIAGPGHSPPADGHPLPPTSAAALDAVATLPPPSVVVHSGGGLQAWWILDEPLLIDDDNRAEVAELVAGWGRALVAAGAAKGWHVDNVADLARVLRPPGTVNRKPSRAPAPVAIVRGEGCGDLYTLDQLTPYLVAAPEPERPPRPPSPPPTLGNLGPADALNLATWAEILEPHGWTYTGTELVDGATVELWRRPGAESPYSLKCWPDGGAVVWSSAVGTPRQGWSKFRTWAELGHGGDMAAAARAARADQRARKGTR